MSKVRSINPEDLTRGKRHHYLLAAVAPRPIAFASTVDKEGNVNLSPFSFFNVFSSSPPVMIFSPARRGRNNTTKDTLENILEVPEVVINIVHHPIVEQMSLSSTEYNTEVNEFVKTGLTQVASEKIKPPRVGESPVSFECKVDQVISLGDTAGAGQLVICKVVKIHIQEAFIDESDHIDTTKLGLIGRMGGEWYCRADGDSLFEIPKPLRTKGIGVDQLPDYVVNDKTLNGNQLARLANIEKLPNQETIDALVNNDQVKTWSTSKYKLLALATQWLEERRANDALALLMYIHQQNE